MHRFLACFFATAATACGVELVISSPTVPAGSAAQIQVSPVKSTVIASGELTFDLDPAVFASITSASVFGASGTAAGYVIVNGLHASVDFVSAGGVAGNPFVVLTAVVRPGAAAGARAAITADPTGSTWRDLDYQPITVSVTPGSVTVGGTLSVSAAQSTGATVHIDGIGFTPATSVDIQAAVISSASFVSATRIDVTLAAPTEITARRVRLRNPDGQRADFYAYWAGPVLSSDPADPFFHAIPMVPLQAYQQGVTSSFRVHSGWLVLQNPNPAPVDIALEVLQSNYFPTGETALRIPAGGVSYQNLSTLGIPLENTVRVLASAPVRVLELSAYTNYFGSGPAILQRSISAVLPIDLGPLRVRADVVGDTLSWVWQSGAAKPAPKSLQVHSADRDQSANFTFSVATASGGNWLSAVSAGGATCATPGGACTDPSITATIDPAGLSPGIYRGTINLSPVPTTVRPDVVPTVVAVALTVSGPLQVNTVISSGATFVKPGPPGFPNSQSFNITTDMFPSAFSVAFHADSGGNWLTATPSAGTAPAVVTISGDLSALPPGRYSGEVILTGGGNTVVIPAVAFVYGGLQLRAEYPLQFSARAGDPAPPALMAAVIPECLYCTPDNAPNSVPFTASVKTFNGGNWLSAQPSTNSVVARVNPSGLTPGAYTGVVTVSSDAVTGNTEVPVILTVWSGSPPAITAGPSSLFALAQAGGAYTCVSSGSTALNVSAAASTSDGGSWLKLQLYSTVTPSCVLAAFDGSQLAPGTYTGTIVLTSTGQSLSVPVTFIVPGPPPPLLGSIVNAASSIEGPIAVGEIVTIHGAGFGSANRAEVFFDTTPAYLTYSSDSQINAVVPFDVFRKSAVNISVRLNGQTSAWTVPVAPAAPGIFTLDSTGTGAAAVLNQDNSINGPGIPAARGSVIQIFATGYTPDAPGPLTVNISGMDAAIQYAGPAPGTVTGLVQLNATVPASVTPGPAVPIAFAIGPLQSQLGATIAVK